MEEFKKSTQPRKKYAQKGEREQKMISFRADAETLSILETVKNKGRLLNELVQDWRRSRNRPESDDNPYERQIEDLEA